MEQLVGELMLHHHLMKLLYGPVFGHVMQDGGQFGLNRVGSEPAGKDDRGFHDAFGVLPALGRHLRGYRFNEFFTAVLHKYRS
ncbi:hypothetical protein D3C76_1774290 [compost metagenome]